MKKKQWFIVLWILLVYMDYYVRFFKDPCITPLIRNLLSKTGLW